MEHHATVVPDPRADLEGEPRPQPEGGGGAHGYREATVVPNGFLGPVLVPEVLEEDEAGAEAEAHRRGHRVLPTEPEREAPDRAGARGPVGAEDPVDAKEEVVAPPDRQYDPVPHRPEGREVPREPERTLNPEPNGVDHGTAAPTTTRRRAAVLDGGHLTGREVAEGHSDHGLEAADLAPMISDDRLERHDLTADLREVGGVAGAGRFARPVDEDAERRARDTRLRLRTSIRNHLHGAEVPDLRLERGQARLVIAHHALNLGVRGHEHPAAGKDRGAEPPRREALARTPEGAGRRHDTVARRASAPGRLKTAAAGTAGLPHQHSAPRPTIQAGRSETVGESDRARARRHLAARRVGLPLETRVSLTDDGGELRAQRGELGALPAAGHNGPPRRLLRPPRKVGAGGGLRRGLTRQAAGQNDPLLTGGLARRRHAAGAAGQRLGRGRGADGAVGGGARVDLSRRGAGVEERGGQHGRREKQKLLHRGLLEGNFTPLVFFLHGQWKDRDLALTMRDERS